VEQIIFIIVVSVGVIGLVSVMNVMIVHSADPMQTKQMMAIADSILGEVIHQPFTWCDPDDDNASTATSYGNCTTSQSSATSGESRNGGAGAVFDNVIDYAGRSYTNVSDPSGTVTMTGYDVAIAVVNAGASLGLADDSAALSVTVTVTHGTDSYALTGYRFRYAPRY